MRGVHAPFIAHPTAVSRLSIPRPLASFTDRYLESNFLVTKHCKGGVMELVIILFAFVYLAEMYGI